MSVFEDLAKLAEEEDCIRLRTRFSDRYRAIVGIDLARRDQVRGKLESLLAHDDTNIDRGGSFLERRPTK